MELKLPRRGNRGKRKPDSADKPKKEEDMDCTANTSPTTGLLNLPEEVVRQIFSYLSEKETFWGIGQTCRTLMAYAVYNISTIEMPPGSEKATLDKLKLIVQQNEFADWVRYVIMLGDHSKSLLQLAHDELPGTVQN